MTTQEPTTPQKSEELPDDHVETVVGIAASAGGLEAMSLLAQHLPNNLSCTYILAQHMSPHHASVLSTLLARETRLNVVAVETTSKLMPNTIYVPVPKTDLVIDDGHVTSVEPNGHAAQPKPSADRLFASIARNYGENSVGIVLSGTGSDGSYGIQDIREAGGITIAQDAGSSKYDTMPAAAVETGCVDLILSPRQIGEQLANILNRPRDFSFLQNELDLPTEYDDLFHMLLAHTKVNFRQYKENTISRRIQRRMIALGFEDYAQYVAFCRDKPEELDALYRDLLISVTHFFRDTDQFDALRRALEAYIDTDENRPVRIWVAGCATGEEVYSIAFMVCDILGFPFKREDRKVQIFATDIDEAALQRARAGSYPAAARAYLTDEIVEKYFAATEDVLRVKSEIRNMVLFSRHNVFQDPPFNEIDLVSFRNTLIYFDSPLQEKVMSRLLYALRPSGLLFLGTSENIGSLEPYFERVQDGAKLYQKRTDATFDHKALVRFGLPTSREAFTKQRAIVPSASPEMEDNEMFSVLAAAVAQTGFLANSQKDIIRIFGDIGEYTRVTDAVRGRLTTNTLKSELSSEAASLIPLCLKHEKARDGLWREMEGRGFNRVRLRGYPVKPPQSKNPLVLVSIETDLVEAPTEAPSNSTETNSYLSYVESELADAREALQITMEELQTSNEELQSTNEELQSTNEELQSTNEELETSNEELQSTNEELITVNEELLINSDELSRIVGEQKAILDAIPVPLLVLDRHLNIKTASNEAQEMFNLTERGKHFGHLSHAELPPDFPAVLKATSDVLIRQQPASVTFDRDGVRSEVRIAPFKHDDGDLAGLTLSVWSSHEIVTQQRDEMNSQIEFLTDTLGAMNGIGVYNYDLSTNEVMWSDEIFRIANMDVLDRPLTYEEAMELHHPDEVEKANAIIQAAIKGDGKFHYQILGRRGQEDFVLESSGVVLYNEDGSPRRLLGSARDYTAYQRQNQLVAHVAELLKEREIGFFSIDVRNSVRFLSEYFLELIGMDKQSLPLREELIKCYVEEDRERVATALANAEDLGKEFVGNVTLDIPGRTKKTPVRIDIRVKKTPTGSVEYVYGSLSRSVTTH